jgi:preprotein translocase subunit SecE
MPWVRDERPKNQREAIAAARALVGKTDNAGSDSEELPSRAPAQTPSSNNGTGFFTIYKKGQGKWTRLGTVFAAVFLGGLTLYNLCFVYMPMWGVRNHQIVWATGAGFLAGFGLLVFWLMNKPTNADFLIATDSEMKKVNWTTKGELIGSTRVVILFLIFIALFLFVVDLLFAEFFHLITVLRSGPFH